MMLMLLSRPKPDGGHTALPEAGHGSAEGLYKKTVSLITSALTVLRFSLGFRWPSTCIS